MTIQTDVKSATTSSTASLVSARTRIKGLVITSTTTAGTVALADGGSGGTTKLSIATPAVASVHNVLIPGEGVLFETDVYATLTNVASITAFYG